MLYKSGWQTTTKQSLSVENFVMMSFTLEISLSFAILRVFPFHATSVASIQYQHSIKHSTKIDVLSELLGVMVIMPCLLQPFVMSHL